VTARYEVTKEPRILRAVPDDPTSVAIGFSGTRKGMTDAQYAVVADILKTRKPLFAHHGCCIGADAQFNELAQELRILTVGHPPTDITSLAAALELDYRRPARRFLDRNMQIIKETGA
jgi:hypothetical protein